MNPCPPQADMNPFYDSIYATEKLLRKLLVAEMGVEPMSASGGYESLFYDFIYATEKLLRKLRVAEMGVEPMTSGL